MNVRRTHGRYGNALALIIALALVHAFLVVNDGLFADDWLIFKIKPNYPVNTDFLIHGAGHPFLYIYCTLANLSGHPAAFMNTLALTGILLGAVNLKSMMTRLKFFSDFEATVFSFLVWSYAGYRCWAVKVLASYVFSFALLCLGLNLLSVIVYSERPHKGLRFVSLVVIFCSFSLNSMIAAYGIGLFAIFAAQCSDQPLGQKTIASRLAIAIKTLPDFLILPFLYWFSTRDFFPKTGPYEAYYLLRLPKLGEIQSGLIDFWTWGFRKIARQALDLAGQSSLLPIAAFAIALLFIRVIAHQRQMGSLATRQNLALIWPLPAAFVTFVVCASPYLASGIQPTEHFFESRHLILFGIPLGLVLIWTFRIIDLIFANRTIAYGAVAAALSINLCALWNGYLFEQARWLRQEALISDLSHQYSQPPAAVFNLADGFLDYPWHAYFGISEVTGALHLSWDRQTLFGFTGRRELPTAVQQAEGSAFRSMGLSASQATIEFVPKEPVLTNYALAARYYLCLIRGCDIDSVLSDVASTKVLVGSIPGLARYPSHP